MGGEILKSIDEERRYEWRKKAKEKSYYFVLLFVAVTRNSLGYCENLVRESFLKAGKICPTLF